MSSKKWSLLLDRRKFLKISGLTVGAATLGGGTSFAQSLPQPRRQRQLFMRTRRNAPAVLGQTGVREVNTTCMMCNNFCGQKAIVVGTGAAARVQRVEGLPAHPLSRGALCNKGHATVERLYDPDRLRRPVVKNADGSWSHFNSDPHPNEAEWDLALAYVAQKLIDIRNKWGPEVVCQLSHTIAYPNWWDAFDRNYGIRNKASVSTICDPARRLGGALCFQNERIMMDFRNAKYIMMCHNIFEAPRHYLRYLNDVMQAKKGGAKLVVVDPRVSYSAAKADQYVPIEPGTDLMLFNSMMQVMLDNSLTASGKTAATNYVRPDDADLSKRGIQNTVETTAGANDGHWKFFAWVNREYIMTKSRGINTLWNEVKNAIYAPAAAETVCGVPSATIVQLAREFCGVNTSGDGVMDGRGGIDVQGFANRWKVCINGISSIGRYSNSTETYRAMMCLLGLVGGYSHPGGQVRRKQGTIAARASYATNYPTADRVHAQAGWGTSTDLVPVDGAIRPLIPFAILTPNAVPGGPRATTLDGVTYAAYQARPVNSGKGIKCIITYATDPAMVDQNADAWQQALGKLEFGLVIDAYITTTAHYYPPGSVVLPEAIALERTNSSRPHSDIHMVALTQKAVEPRGPKSAHYIFYNLGKKFGAIATANSNLVNRSYWLNYNGSGYIGSNGEQLDEAEETKFQIEVANTFNTAPFPITRTATFTPRMDTEVQVTHTDFGTITVPSVKSAGFWAAPNPAAYPRYGEVTHGPGGIYTLAIDNYTGAPRTGNETQYLLSGGSFAPTWSPPLAKTATHPLRLMAGCKVMQHVHAASFNLKYLSQSFGSNLDAQETNLVIINPIDAGARSITNGAWAFVVTKIGRMRIRALISERMRPGTVSILHGYGINSPTNRAAHLRGVNPNRLIDNSRIDQFSGGFTPYEEICQVIRA